MTTWRKDLIDVELLLDAFHAELDKLMAISAKGDFSAKGDAEFEAQKARVKDAKEAVIRAENRGRK